MNNEKNANRTPRRMPGGQKMKVPEKANDFRAAIIRLFKELKGYKIVIYVALVLAILSAVLTILAPNRLSDLADEISKGLIINQDNMKELSEKIQENITNGMIEFQQMQISQMGMQTSSSEKNL